LLFQPDRMDERARIEAQGGKVIQWNGYQVSGILVVKYLKLDERECKSVRSISREHKT
jgi:hypothetical protein